MAQNNKKSGYSLTTVIGVPIFLALFGILLSYLIYANTGSWQYDIQINDKIWTQNTKNDTSIKEFKVTFSDEEKQDLLTRLNMGRKQQAPLEDAQSHYGFRSDELENVVEQWKNWDFSKFTTVLNKFKHYKTLIKGLNVHFIHINPGHTPVLLLHGWPGSVYEFYEMADILYRQGFTIVIPSIPGFGFSDAPTKMGFGFNEAGDIFWHLMIRLGYQKFYIQGGDYGSLMAKTIGVVHPENVLGVHFNVFPPWQPAGFVCSQFPSLCLYSQSETDRMDTGYLLPLLLETGYLHIQATKPDTVTTGLNNDPIGLAAYILEKFGSMTNQANLDKINTLEGWDMDHLFINLMIYWTNGNIRSSARFYKEFFSNLNNFKTIFSTIDVPTAYADFPHEVFGRNSETMLRRNLINLVQHNVYHDKGGHFAALECPKEMAADFASFVSKVEKL